MDYEYTRYELSFKASDELVRFVRERGDHSPKFIANRFEHCQERLSTRYGFDIDYDTWEDMNLRIFKSEGTTYVDAGNTENTSLYVLEYEGKRLFVAYADDAFVMMTAFPRHDLRFGSINDGSYVPRAISDHSKRYVEAKEAAAAAFISAAATSKPFADVLKPMLEEAVERKPIGALFASLDAAIGAKTFTDDREEKVQRLEREIEELRSGMQAHLLNQRFLHGAREMAGATFEAFNAGLIDEDDARSTATAIEEKLIRMPERVVTVKPVKQNPTVPGAVPTSRRARNAEMLKLREEGWTNTELGRRYGLSIQAIGWNIKQERARMEAGNE